MKYVLFVCTQNAGRSQIAEALFNHRSPDGVRAESAGSKPAGHLHPEVVEAMAELGIDLSHRRPRRLTVDLQLGADWAVTMGCGDACPYVPARVEDWDIPDPAGEPLGRVREIRDLIGARVDELVDEHLDAIRSDRTAHQLRLATLLPVLVREFEEQRDPEEIRACADAILDQYSDANVRTFVQTVALRRARACLRAEICDPAAA
ncbi:MAG: arsenate reductase ArsC [Solirubrobacteraceae bacterium]|jgi:arsenate reductase|nr:arsenate reductase ArsC [Solirubrobacteraceae bacterium]